MSENELFEPPTETKRERTIIFTPPREIWGLLIEEIQIGDQSEIGKLLCCDGDVGSPFFAFDNKESALECAHFQLHEFGIGCIPVRLK